jgi:hypothetical protein
MQVVAVEVIKVLVVLEVQQVLAAQVELEE